MEEQSFEKLLRNAIETDRTRSINRWLKVAMIKLNVNQCIDILKEYVTNHKDTVNLAIYSLPNKNDIVDIEAYEYIKQVSGYNDLKNNFIKQSFLSRIFPFLEPFPTIKKNKHDR